MNKIKVDLGERSYNIIVGSGGLSKVGAYLAHLEIGRDAVVITNPAIKKLYGRKLEESLVKSGFNARFITVPDTERSKSEKECLKLLNGISKFDGTTRRIFIIAFGGGVIGDLAGFVASIYKRGIPYIQIPTTLLAQVDSAIGGKVAIDLKVGKNLAGSFYQPRLVLSDVSLLGSLPRRDLISGLAEVLKYGIIKSPELFKFLERNYRKVLKCDTAALNYIVYKCSSIKAEVVSKDELDNKNVRVILNLGHTIGHAIETSANYSRRYTHGHAVSLGILAACFISGQLNLLNESVSMRIRRLIKNIGLPTSLKGIKAKDIISSQEHDKKFIHGKNRFVLPVGIGKAIVKEGIQMRVIEKSVSMLLG